jgi:SHS2 domain-containing protein
MKEFELIEHTSDIGLRVYGGSLSDLFKNAARGLFNLIVDTTLAPTKEKKIHLEAQTLEDLLVNWLSELISGFFAYKFLPGSYNITINKGSPNTLEAKIKGAEYDPYSQKINREVKAATYHNLKIEEDAGGFVVEIIFDV